MSETTELEALRRLVEETFGEVSEDGLSKLPPGVWVPWREDIGPDPRERECAFFTYAGACHPIWGRVNPFRCSVVRIDSPERTPEEGTRWELEMNNGEEVWA